MVDTVNNNEASAALLNPYLFKLEFKPKPVLSHELGAGSLCLKCKCPGLDLHFWRKMCKNCYCRLDEHDIILPDDQDHGEIVIRKLFGANAKESAATYRQEAPVLQVHQQVRVNKENSGYEGIADKLHQIHINKQSGQHNSSQKFSFSSQTLSEENVKSQQNTKANQYSSMYTQFSEQPAKNHKLNEELGSRNNNSRHAFSSTPSNSSSSTSTAGTLEQEPSVQEYTWMPAGERLIVDKYMHSLPEYERPIVGSEGAQLRRQRLAFQLPYHDCDVEATNSLKNDLERQAHQSFVDFVKENVVGVGEIVNYTKHHQQNIARTVGVQAVQPEACKNCEKGLNFADVGVVTDHGRPNEIWHPGCFRCDVCHQLLVDMLYFFKDGQYYCGRHYGEKVYPRCSGCDELIFAKEYTFAEEKSWHVDHFCCFGCDMHLGGHRYVSKEDKSYCIDCYMHKFARTCLACKNKIAPFDSRVSHKEFHWHANASCFKCKKCSVSLANQKFLLKEENVFCCAECKTQFVSS